MKLISLDPSSTHTGLAVWTVTEEWTEPELIHRETIVPEGDTEQTRRIDMVYKVVLMFFEWKAGYAVLERPSPIRFGRGSSSRIDTYTKAVAAIEDGLVRELGPDAVYGIYPQTWKSSAKKKDTIKMVNEKFNLELRPKDEHEADAIGVGDWFIHRMSYSPIPPIGQCTM